MESGLIYIVESYGLIGIFVAMAIENIGIPFIISAAFVLAHQLVNRGVYDFWFMYWLIVVAQVAGAAAAYGIGHWLGRRIVKYLPRGHGLQAASQTLKNWYQRYGSATVFFANLVGYVRPWASLVAGWSRYQFTWFMIWTALGTMLFVYLMMSAMGFLVWAWVESPVWQVILSIIALLAVAVVIYLAVRSYRPAQKHSKKHR